MEWYKTEIAQGSSVPTSQTSTLSLVTPYQNRISRIGPTNSVHQPTNLPSIGQQQIASPVPGLTPIQFQTRMIEYFTLLKKELQNSIVSPISQGSSSSPNATSPLKTLDMQQMTSRNSYKNNSIFLKPRTEAINLSENAKHRQSTSIRREFSLDMSPPARKLFRDEEMKPIPVSPSQSPCKNMRTNIKISNSDGGRKEDNPLEVSIEFNGVMYKGFLFPQQT